MAVVSIKKSRGVQTDRERWLQLYQQQQRLQAELAETAREMRSLRPRLYEELRTWGLSDEALRRALIGVY